MKSTQTTSFILFCCEHSKAPFNFFYSFVFFKGVFEEINITYECDFFQKSIVSNDKVSEIILHSFISKVSNLQ